MRCNNCKLIYKIFPHRGAFYLCNTNCDQEISVKIVSAAVSFSIKSKENEAPPVSSKKTKAILYESSDDEDGKFQL